MLAYSNNGLGFRAIDASMALEPGEVAFSDAPSEAALLAAFPGRPAALEAFNTILTNHPIIAQINALEATQHRTVREAILTGDPSRLKAIEEEVSALRATLVSSSQ